ncbi:copper resistance protein CopC [Actinomadura sp. B10D3]|uniref:copper resistance CopC family protein n=1 Tax=Actinomadura sp. B10D3 TaxID=3153557 RepID=UPI00325DC845
MNIFKPRRPVRRLGLVAALALAFGTFAAPPALAHSELVSSTPEKGATAASVSEVKLVFSDKIRLAKVVVTDGAKKEFQAGAAERSGTTVTQKLSGPLPAGSYTVAYRVVGEDGHPIEKNDLTFSVGEGGAGASGAPGAGGVGAEQQTGDAATADEQPLKIDQQQAEEKKDDSGSGMVLWVLIGAGLLVGAGIGVAIVFRAKRTQKPAPAESEKEQVTTGSE